MGDYHSSNTQNEIGILNRSVDETVDKNAQ